MDAVIRQIELLQSKVFWHEDNEAARDRSLPAWGDLKRDEQQALLDTEVNWEFLTEAEKEDVERRVMEGEDPEFWMDGVVVGEREGDEYSLIREPSEIAVVRAKSFEQAVGLFKQDGITFIEGDWIPDQIGDGLYRFDGKEFHWELIPELQEVVDAQNALVWEAVEYEKEVTDRDRDRYMQIFPEPNPNSRGQAFQVWHADHAEAIDFPERFTRVATVRAENLVDALRLTQRGDRPWQENVGVFAKPDVARSTTVGDVILDDQATAYRVKADGFEASHVHLRNARYDEFDRKLDEMANRPHAQPRDRQLER
jgi:hypothetical protein